MMHPLTRWASEILLRHYLPRRFPRPPIFIGGAPRSGTTLLISILGSHPHIHAIDYETAAFHPRYRPEKLVAALMFEPSGWRRLRVPAGKIRYCEKTPANIRHVDEIAALYRGRVRLINIFRDGRDVVTSRHPERPGEYWVPIKRWVRDVKFGLKAEGKGLALSVKYEDLVAQPEPTLRKLCDYLDEPFLPSLLEYHSADDGLSQMARTAWNHPPQAVNTHSLRKWERPEHRARVEEFYANTVAVDLLHRLGYQ